MGNIADSFDEAYKQNTLLPGQEGIDTLKEKYAIGGRVGFADGPDNPKKSLIKKIPKVGKILQGLDYLKDLLKKKTITVKRGESGTEGASSSFSDPNYKGKYYTPEGGGFGTPAEDARYYSKLGGDEGNPKVFTAELTPEEIEEGLRLRALDSKDPEIGDIILPKSAEDKVKIDYLNTIRAQLEKYLKMADGGRVNFKDGSENAVITIDDKIDEMISFYQDYLKQGGKMDFVTFSKQYIPENFAAGGRVGFADGPEDPSKRKFMKIASGLASLPIVGRFFDVAQVAEKAAPAVVEAVKTAPPYFLGLIDKIRALGKVVDPKETSYRSDPNIKNIYDYGDYRMFEDVDGGVAIKKDKLMATDYGDATVSEEYMQYSPGKIDKKTGKKIEDDYYEENTSYADQDGELKDVEEGVLDETMEEGTFSKEELEQLIIENIKKGEK